MEDHLTDQFLQEVVDHLVAAGFRAVNEQFNYTFSVDLSRGPAKVGDRSVLFGLANPTWGGSVSYLDHFDPETGSACYEPDETDRGYVEAFVPDHEEDPRVVATAIGIALLRHSIEVDPDLVERAVREGEAFYEMEARRAG